MVYQKNSLLRARPQSGRAQENGVMDGTIEDLKSGYQSRNPTAAGEVEAALKWYGVGIPRKIISCRATKRKPEKCKKLARKIG